MFVNNRGCSSKSFSLQGNKHERVQSKSLKKMGILWMIITHKIAARSIFLDVNINNLCNRTFRKIAAKIDRQIQNYPKSQ